MAIYIFGQSMEYILENEDCMQKYKMQMSEKAFVSSKYIFMEVMEHRKINYYSKIGIATEQLICIYQYLTDNHTLQLSMKVLDKLEELKSSLHYTEVDYRDKEILLIKERYVIAAILLDEKDEECFWGIRYFESAKLIRMEIYTDRILYVNSYITATSEQGLYAKLSKRTFYNKDGSVAYEQIFEGKKEWFLFPDGRLCTKSQMMEEFIKTLNLSEEDVILLDNLVPNELLRSVFMFGKTARLVALARVRNSSKDAGNNEVAFLSGGYYDWFPYMEMLDTIIVSTEEWKKALLEELTTYRCNIPDIKVDPINGKFTFAILYESYDDNLALSWKFSGKTDGFLICDEFGVEICEIRNMHQHYFLIKGYEKKTKFILKAFMDTMKGKMVTAESEEIQLCTRKYDKPKVSLVIPAYNAEEYIARAIDNALAQSFIDLEIIVVDDGSTDATSDIIDWYVGKFKNVMGIHQENGGVSLARNNGIEYANGEYIGFMDSDDMIHPDMIVKLYNSVRKNECDISITSNYTITNAGYIATTQYMMKEDVAMPIEKFLHECYIPYGGLGVVVWNKLYRKSLIKEHPYPILAYEDEAWTPYILSYASRICYLDGCLYEYDRTIREETLADKCNFRPKSEVFELQKNAIIFYLTNGDSSKIGLLKELAKARLKDLERYYEYEEYRKLEQWIDENY